jgi:iron complex outermembrane receptor protein
VKHVGQQFLDNTSNENRKIDAYSFGNFGINYNLEDVVFQKITFGLLVNNIWNSLYENNGYTFSYIAGGQTTTENFYYPQAGTNFLARVVIAF